MILFSVLTDAIFSVLTTTEQNIPYSAVKNCIKKQRKRRTNQLYRSTIANIIIKLQLNQGNEPVIISYAGIGASFLVGH